MISSLSHSPFFDNPKKLKKKKESKINGKVEGEGLQVFNEKSITQRNLR